MFKPQLILGTAEFNPEGYAGKPCPPIKEIIRIFNLAHEGGITTLDTAEAYNCDNTLTMYGSGFDRMIKNREKDDKYAYYHYKNRYENSIEKNFASVYSIEQMKATKFGVSIPLSINNTEFIPYLVEAPNKYARSVFNRGRLFKEGYTVKDCLSFVKRQNVHGVIVGVNSVKELEQILKVW